MVRIRCLDIRLQLALNDPALAVAACGSGALIAPENTPDSSAADSSAPDPSAADSSAPDSPAPDAQSSLAVHEGVVKVTLSRAYLGAIPGCTYSTQSVTYTRATQTAEWSGCDADAGVGQWVTDAGGWPSVAKKLSVADAQSVEAALSVITYTVRIPNGSEPCPYDGREYFMRTVDKNNSEVLYSQYNTNCYNYRAANVSDAFNLLMSLK